MQQESHCQVSWKKIICTIEKPFKVFTEVSFSIILLHLPSREESQRKSWVTLKEKLLFLKHCLKACRVSFHLAIHLTKMSAKKIISIEKKIQIDYNVILLNMVLYNLRMRMNGYRRYGKPGVKLNITWFGKVLLSSVFFFFFVNNII